MLLLFLAVFLPGLLIRLPLLLQSLWYDEMYMILTRILGPWKGIFAGTYIPNNHILYTFLARLTYQLTGEFDLVLASRLPSAIAGAITGVAIAWPLLSHRSTKTAVALGTLISLHPWMLSISGQARGYSLLLLLAALSSLLFTARRGVLYAICIILMLYTHPIGLAIVIGQAVVVLSGRAWNRRAWLISTLAAGCITILIYLPMLSSARGYWSQQHPPSIQYASFVSESFTYALAGWVTPPAELFAVAAVVITVVGCILLWKREPSLRPLIEIFSAASVAGILIPLTLPAAGEARSLLWLIPLVCMGIQGLIGALPRTMTTLGWTGALALIVILDIPIFRVPVQPIREATIQARTMAEPGQLIVGVYLGAVEARATYDLDAVVYQLSNSTELSGLQNVESFGNRPPLLLIFDDILLHRDQPDLWEYIHLHYAQAARIPGRGSDALIFKPLPHPVTTSPASQVGL